MHDDTSQAETYIGRMKSDATKVEGLMICRKFKQAYLLAVKLQDIRLVQKLKEAAKVPNFKKRLDVDVLLT